MSGVKIWFLEAGSCRHPEFIVLQGGRLRSARFGASVAVIEHPRLGIFLFDTGYSGQFRSATRNWPYKLYAWTTPVDVSEEETAKSQLAKFGINAADVGTIILSHFHADHAGGAADFPRATYVFQESAYSAVKDLRGFAAVRAGFLPHLMPTDFEQRARSIRPDEFSPSPGFDFGRPGVDLCGDGSLVLVDLPGHAQGHSGLFVNASDGARYFLVSDAAWTSASLAHNRLPSQVTRVVHHDWRAYRQTIQGLHAFVNENPKVKVVPCHCAEAYAEVPQQRPA